MRPLWVAALFALLGWVSIHNGWFVFRGASEYADRLQMRTEHHLSEAGHGWAQLEMRGQTAHLVGVAPTTDAREDALAVAARAAGRGGALLGGVRRVTHEVEANEQVARYWLEAHWDGARATLSGYVPHSDDIEALRAYVGTFDVDVSSAGLVTADGAPSGFSWTRAARFGVTHLLTLDTGVLLLERHALVEAPDTNGTQVEGDLLLTGEVASQLVLDDIDTAFEARPLELVALTARAEITLTGDTEPDTLAASCERAIYMATDQAAIRFYSGSASFQPESEAVLNAVADALLECGTAVISVSVDAGVIGDPLFNRELSHRRTRAVIRALSERGVDSALIRAHDLGASDVAAEAGVVVPSATAERVVFMVGE